jgi:hypothetical protein
LLYRTTEDKIDSIIIGALNENSEVE